MGYRDEGATIADGRTDPVSTRAMGGRVSADVPTGFLDRGVAAPSPRGGPACECSRSTRVAENVTLLRVNQITCVRGC